MREHEKLRLSLMPSEEEIKKADELAEKFRTQRLRILDEEPTRTLLGKIGDFLAPKVYNLNSDFGHTVAEYVRFKHVVAGYQRDYDRDRDSDTELLLDATVSNFRTVTDKLNALYYYALGENRVDEGFGKELDDLRASKEVLTAKIDDLTSKLTECEKNLQGLKKRLPDTAEFGDINSSG